MLVVLSRYLRMVKMFLIGNYIAVLDKLDNEEAHKKLLHAGNYTEQEKAILSLWKTEPNIST